MTIYPNRNALRLATLALCTAVGSAAMWAQTSASSQDQAPQQQTDGAPPPHERPNMEHQIEHLSKHLNLSADQTTQVRAIFTDTGSQIAAIRQDESLSHEQKGEKMKSLHESAHAKIRAVLTDDQKPKFDEMVAHERDHMDHDGRPGAQSPPPAPPAQ